MSTSLGEMRGELADGLGDLRESMMRMRSEVNIELTGVRVQLSDLQAQSNQSNERLIQLAHAVRDLQMRTGVLENRVGVVEVAQSRMAGDATTTHMRLSRLNGVYIAVAAIITLAAAVTALLYHSGVLR